MVTVWWPLQGNSLQFFDIFISITADEFCKKKRKMTAKLKKRITPTHQSIFAIIASYTALHTILIIFFLIQKPYSILCTRQTQPQPILFFCKEKHFVFRKRYIMLSLPSILKGLPSKWHKCIDNECKYFDYIMHYFFLSKQHIILILIKKYSTTICEWENTGIGSCYDDLILFCSP